LTYGGFLKPKVFQIYCSLPLRPSLSKRSERTAQRDHHYQGQYRNGHGHDKDVGVRLAVA
jgi:hypothetical protein